MAKAALEAINGFNLFGERGSNYSVVYVDIDAHNRNRNIFETLLPRESNTKQTDASLLATISFPAFATQNDQLYTKTKDRIVKHLIAMAESNWIHCLTFFCKCIYLAEMISLLFILSVI